MLFEYFSEPFGSVLLTKLTTFRAFFRFRGIFSRKIFAVDFFVVLLQSGDLAVEPRVILQRSAFGKFAVLRPKIRKKQ